MRRHHTCRESLRVSEHITFDGGGVCTGPVKGAVFDGGGRQIILIKANCFNDTGAVFDGGGGQIILIKANCFNDGGGGRVPFDGGGLRGGLRTSNGVVRFNDGGGGPFDRGGGDVCCVSNDDVFDYSSANSAIIQPIGASDARVGSCDCGVVLCVNGLLDGCVVFTLSSFASTPYFAYLSGGQRVYQSIGRVQRGTRSQDQCVCLAVSVVLSRVGSNESLVYSCAVMDRVVRVCWFGWLLVANVTVVVVVLLHQSPSLHTDGAVATLLLAFLLTFSLIAAICCCAAVFPCVQWTLCFLASAAAIIIIASANTHCHGGAWCGTRTRLVFRAHSAGYRRACTTMTVALRAIVGLE